MAEAVAKKDTDSFFGPMAACDGSVFAITVKAQPENLADTVWRYDTSANTWKDLGMPVESDSEEKKWVVTESCLAAAGGKVYLLGSQNEEVDDPENPGEKTTKEQIRLWSCASNAESEEDWKMDEHAMPHSTNLGTLDGKLPFVEGTYSEMKVEGADASGEDGVNIDFVLYDPNAGTFTKLDGSLPKGIDMLHAKISSCGNMLYIYAPRNTDDPRPEIDGYGALLRCTYDSAAKSIRTENLTAGLKKALGGTLISAYDTASYGDKTHRHFAIAAVPDGVAIIGSATAGEDTHIIYNGSTEPVAFERTSSYHGAFFPLAAYDNGTLYATGYNSAEQGSVYFRSTHVEHKWGDGEVTKEATVSAEGVRTFTCADCGATKTEAIPVVQPEEGETYETAGVAYKVTSAAGGTVTFVKAKNAKKVIVPATVKMGGKTYKVTAIASGAFAKANKVKSAVIGKNVKKVGKKAFKGAKKLKTLIVKSKKLKKRSVKGSLKGSKVKTVKVKVGKKKVNKKYAKKYKKIFTKKNCGKKVKVKA